MGAVPRRLRRPTSKGASPTFNLISCEAKEVVYHRISVFEYGNTMGINDDEDEDDGEDDEIGDIDTKKKGDCNFDVEEMSAKRKGRKKSPERKEALDETGAAYEEVKKDLSALSKEEQMDVLYSSAPELVGLLLELNDAIEQLERKVDPLLSLVKKEEIMMEKAVRYLEVNQLLFLSYWQAITFNFLKSEGQPIRDHLACFVEIQSLLDKCLLLSKIFSTNLLELEWDRRLVTYDDFDDDSINMRATSFSNGHAGSLSTSKLSQIVSAKLNKPKVVSGEDDLPKRDDVGESMSFNCWLELESNLRLMLGLGMKLTILGLMRMLTWKWTSAVPTSPEPIDGKRHINYQMEKNRGLTWKHKKQTKNRRKYKEQHKKKVNCRKGQLDQVIDRVASGLASSSLLSRYRRVKNQHQGQKDHSIAPRILSPICPTPAVVADQQASGTDYVARTRTRTRTRHGHGHEDTAIFEK
ncbi:hypothetical protein SO802_022172 [Lithocarpus litseifolius]|uniref:Sas10 C-terminal domain-containing protein n=1 Tax=Lithocarpus litseifolius TaxID=425828 RepID=A0AAW2CH01_9ROSI